ncbi:MAG: hypothetical protein PHP08_00135 [Candidatus Dojkabacteria bacterium]|nr:hypothetical protein [Candidatus Dojkabacteria bacterium]
MDITNVNKAILYEKITDYALFNNRTLSQSISDISSLKPDLIFRSFWQWGIVVNSCNTFTDPIAKQTCILNGYNYEGLQNSINQLKQSLPQTLIIGGLPVQNINKDRTYNPITDTLITYPDTWNMALDPAKWGITSITKQQLQCQYAQTENWYPSTSDCSLYDPNNVCCYFPDLTNPQYQEVFLSWAYKQIDSGVDGIWIDMFTRQLILLYQIVNDMSHPSIVDTTNSMEYIINSIHNYGLSKGKQIYVGTWASIAAIDKIYSIDFLTVSPRIEDVSLMSYNKTYWDNVITTIKNKYPSTKIIGFIDWANSTNTPLGKFSQVLTHQQQLNFLKISKDFFNSKGITFSYPVHGGWMGAEALIKSFGTRKEYDSKAPEFNSYNTIKNLMGITTFNENKYIYIAGGLLALALLWKS